MVGDSERPPFPPCVLVLQYFCLLQIHLVQFKGLPRELIYLHFSSNWANSPVLSVYLLSIYLPSYLPTYLFLRSLLQTTLWSGSNLIQEGHHLCRRSLKQHLLSVSPQGSILHRKLPLECGDLATQLQNRQVDFPLQGPRPASEGWGRGRK